MKKADKFLKIVEWSDEDKCYIGSAPGFVENCCHGKDEAKVYKELCTIVEEWVQIYKKDGLPLPQATVQKDYSGNFVLRVGKELHKGLSLRAIRAGQSLNAYCRNALKGAMSN